MKRATPLLFAILLGAIASGVGVGIFLKLANDDRNRLSRELESLRAETVASAAESERVAEEANRKVAEANAEIRKAEDLLRTLEEERLLKESAKPLRKPGSAELRGWKSIVSFHQEMGLLIPSRTEVESDTKEALIAVESTVTAAPRSDPRWLSITPYDAGLESNLLASFTTSTGIAYLVDDALLTGRKGVVGPAREPMMVLIARKNGEKTHVIWVKDPGTFVNDVGFERLLATFEFSS
jgi:hypothetical protein